MKIMSKEHIDVFDIIRDAELESTDTMRYYAACLGYLWGILQGNPCLGDRDTRERVEILYRWFFESPEETGDLDGKHLEELSIDLLLYGMIGKALFFLNGRSSGQFAKEAVRLLQTKDINQMRGNIWLFQTAGRLAQGGVDIHFIPERDGRTPDFTASRGEIRFHVEANTRSQLYRDIRDIRNLIWKLLHDGDNGKAVKFLLPEFDPGVIAVDVSGCDVTANSTGLPPFMKLRPQAIREQREDFRVYDVTQDPNFFAQLENTGNIVECAIRYFQRLDKSKYFVRGLLVGFALKLIKQGDRLSSPKGAFMVLDHRYANLAIPELAPSMYLVDAEPPDIGELGET
jgi:hypothetical protein